MADDYTDPADDPLLPKQQPFTPGSITGLGRVQSSPGLWSDNAYGSDALVPSPDAWNQPGLLGGRADMAVQIPKAFGKTAKDLYQKFKTSTRDITAPGEGEGVYEPGSGSNDPAYPTRAEKLAATANVQEQPMGSNALPQLIADEAPGWGPGRPKNTAVPDIQTDMPVPPELTATARADTAPTERDSSGGKPGAPLDITGGGGRSDPRPELPTGQNGVDTFGNSYIGRGVREALNGFMNWRDQNKMTLLALAGGLGSHQESWGHALGSGFGQAAQYVPQQNALNNQNATMQALINRGVPFDEARAAAGNPALMQQILPRVFGGKQLKWTKVGSDMGGNDIMGWIDEVNGARYDRNGRLLGTVSGGGAYNSAPGAGGAPAGAADDDSAYQLPEGSLAPGVKRFDPTLSGDAFMNQFNPTLRSGIQSYIDGDSKVFNARQKGDQNIIRTLGKMWGQNSGVEISDNDFTEKSQLINDAKKTAPNTFGGQRINGNTAMEHLSTLSDIMVQLHNQGYDYFPGLSHLMNQWKQTGSTDQRALANAYEAAVDKYVQEVGKYYSGSSSGGVNEREDARRRLQSTLTPQEFAQLLRTERDLFTGKLNQLQQTRDQVYRGDTARADRTVGPVIRPETQGRIENIERNIGALRGQGGGVPMSNAPANPPVGPQMSSMPRISNDADRDKLPSGTMYIGPDGLPRRKQ